MTELDTMSREELIERIRQMDEYMNNVIVMWGDRNQLRETLKMVVDNADKEFSEEEAAHASIILQKEGAFDELIEMLRDSFERGGINFAISERMSAIMQTVAEKQS